MRTLEEFREMYHDDLVPKLNILEKERKKIMVHVSILNIIGIIILIYIILNHPKHFKLLSSALLIGWVFIYISITSNYKKRYKDRIIKMVISFIDSNLNYYPDLGIDENTFRASKIFSKDFNRFSSEDYITGFIDDIQIKFSEVNARIKQGKYSANIFDGLFYVADYNKDFKGRTVVLPDIAEKMFGTLGAAFQKYINFRDDDIIKLEDPEFEKYFKVYGDNQINSRYILSTSVMRRLIDFREKNKKNFFISFIDSIVYLAIPVSKNLFEPRIYKTIVDFNHIYEYFEYLQLLIGIIDDLNLNQKIHTMQKDQVSL